MKNDTKKNLQTAGGIGRRVALTLLGMTTLPAIAHAQFLFPNTVVETTPYLITSTVADVNGDGRPDLISLNANTANNDRTLTVLLNNGNGTFKALPPILLGNSLNTFDPNSVAVADVNGDGKPDILTFNNLGYNGYYNGNGSLLLGHGDGTFDPPTPYFTGPELSSIVIADVNGDGKLDVIGLNNNTLGISVLPGNGDGTFGARNDYDANISPGYLFTLIAGDFNGDGKPDLATVLPINDTVAVLLNDGNGGFNAPVKYATGQRPNAVVAVDLNGDGKLDLVVGSSGDTFLSLFYGNGDGTFQPQVKYETGYYVSALTSADVNRDGKPDLLLSAASPTYIDSAVVLLNQGNGAFSAPTAYDAAVQINAIFAADLDGDSRLDIVAVGQNAICLLPGSGSGAFQARATLPVENGPVAAVVFDANGDGKPDLLLPNLSNASVSVLTNNGSGGFTTTDYTVDLSPISLAVADINGDGKPDFVAANYSVGSVTVYRNNGSGGFIGRTDYTVGSLPSVVAFADVTGDGLLDIVTVNSASITILRGNGNGTFGARTDIPLAVKPSVAAIADVNGDGKADVIFATAGSSVVTVLFNNGSGGFNAPVTYSVGGTPVALAVGDVNGDGRPDLAVAYDKSTHVGLLLNAGNGTFGTAADYDLGTLLIKSLTIADVNGDGAPDLLSANSQTISVLPGNGDGTFGVKIEYAVGKKPAVIVTGDFNGDGRTDIVVGNGGEKTVTFLYGQPNAARQISGVVTFEGLVPAAPAQNVTFQFRPVGGGVTLTKTASLSPDGLFSFSTIPSNAYNVWIKGDKTLATVVPVEATGGSVSDIAVLLRAGDANNDNSVDVADFGVLVNAFGSMQSDPTSGYDPNADFNGDGSVDIADFSLLVNNFGESGDL